MCLFSHLYSYTCIRTYTQYVLTHAKQTNKYTHIPVSFQGEYTSFHINSFLHPTYTNAYTHSFPYRQTQPHLPLQLPPPHAQYNFGHRQTQRIPQVVLITWRLSPQVFHAFFLLLRLFISGLRGECLTYSSCY